jgi:hypothetical protein
MLGDFSAFGAAMPCPFGRINSFRVVENDAKLIVARRRRRAVAHGDAVHCQPPAVMPGR